MNRTVTLYIIFLLLTSCTLDKKKKPIIKDDLCLSGHILFIHIGEEDKHIIPFTIYTINDTTHLGYKYKQTDKYLFADFMDGEAYLQDNIQQIDTSVYKQIKNTLLDCNLYNSTKDVGNSGSFKIIIVDGCDSIAYSLYSGDYAAFCFSVLGRIAEENKLKIASDKFEYYKKMQKPNINL